MIKKEEHGDYQLIHIQAKDGIRIVLEANQNILGIHRVLNNIIFYFYITPVVKRDKCLKFGKIRKFAPVDAILQ